MGPKVRKTGTNGGSSYANAKGDSPNTGAPKKQGSAWQKTASSNNKRTLVQTANQRSIFDKQVQHHPAQETLISLDHALEKVPCDNRRSALDADYLQMEIHNAASHREIIQMRRPEPPEGDD